jgi:uncharacterized membrane-anchored protein
MEQPSASPTHIERRAVGAHPWRSVCEDSRRPAPASARTPDRRMTATSTTPDASERFAWSKVPQLTLAFWLVKILATTVGETGGDALSMTLDLGYVVSTLIFLAFFLVTLAAQVRSSRYHPLYYWLVVVATTTVGTTTSDMLDRTLQLGYIKSSIIELALVLIVLLVWHRSTGSIAADRITTRKNEIFYWFTILVSNTLGTALGDFVADDAGLGFQRGALVFAALIAFVALLHFLTPISKAVLFWAAYVLTRPLGATLGDTLTKPLADGGLNFGRFTSSLVIAVGMVLLIATTSLRERAGVGPDAGAH